LNLRALIHPETFQKYRDLVELWRGEVLGQSVDFGASLLSVQNF
jgi:hypothetical protein